jgi:ABC-2 type transport system permease protein
MTTTRPRAGRRAWAHARWETGLVLRNGEQLLLTFLIPMGLLLGLTVTGMFATTTGPARAANALATVLTVSVLSGAFASLAIATGFERRSGALRFLGTTPLKRSELLGGKFLATALVTALSAAVVCVTALIVGWHPTPAAWWALPVLVLGTATCAAWGMLLAGILRAEAVLAVANGVFLALIMFGGVIVPAASLPAGLGTLAPWLPSGALADAFRSCLVDLAPPPLDSIAVAASRTFRWS